MIRAFWFWRLFAVCAVFLLLAGGLLAVYASSAMPHGAETPADEVSAYVRNLALGYGVAGLGVLGILFLLLRPVARDAQEVASGLNAVAEGQFGTLVGRSERGDAGELATPFNRMSARIADRFDETLARLHELEGRERFLQAVLGTMVEAVVAVDGQQRILFANEAARLLLDLRGADVKDRPIWDATRSPGVRDTLRAVLAEGSERQIELELPRTRRVAVLTARPLPGVPTPGAVLVLHDITELRRLENLRRDFVSNVSHELKTPLASIAACAETLLDGALDDPSHNREFVQRIAEQAERLHALILNLIALARIESEEQAFEFEPLPVRRAIEDCVRTHAELADSRSIAVGIEGDQAGESVMADREGLETILDNLVDNAINYTPPGGRVTIRHRREGDRVRIEVADTGIGIPREKLERIFERFYRVDKARSRELGGTGLGLAIVKHLVKVFGGRVSVASEPGKGSTFVVEIPAALQDEG